MNFLKKHAIISALILLILLTLLFILGESSFKETVTTTLETLPPQTQTAAVSDFNSNLVAHYTFDDTTNDAAGSNNGTPVGGPTYVEGKMGKAMQFDGVDDVVNTNTDSVGANAATYSAWIYARSYGEDKGVIIGNGKTVLRVTSSNSLFQFTSNGFSNTVNAASNSLELNKWTHIVVVRESSGVASIYVNGVLSGAGNQNSGTPVSGTTNVLIGNNSPTSSTWDGMLDDVRIYNRVLSTSEIQELYAPGSGGNPGSGTVPETSPSTPSGPTPNTPPSGGTNQPNNVEVVPENILARPTDFYVKETYGVESVGEGNYSFLTVWTDTSSNEEGFVIEYTSDNTTYKTLGTVSADTVRYTGKLPAGSKYKVRVRAVKGMMHSFPSNELEFVTLHNPYPFRTYSIDTTSTKLQWRDLSSKETGYQIERSSNGGPFSVITQQASSAFHLISANPNYYLFTDTNNGAGLQTGSTYTYRVRAYNTLGPSPFSNPPTTSIAPGVKPIAPESLQLTLTPTSVRLDFVDMSNNEQEFVVERSTDQVNWTVVGNINTIIPDSRRYYDNETEPAPRSFHNNKNIQSGQTYYYRVYAKNGIGNSPYAYASKSITIASTPSAGVTSWYVWKDAKGTSSGESWINAWRDVEEINWAVVKPGDTVYISGDIYDSPLHVYAAGEKGNPVTIRPGSASPNPSGHEQRVVFPSIKIQTQYVVVDGSLDKNYTPLSAEHALSNINMEVRNSPDHGITATGVVGVEVRFIKIDGTTGDGIRFVGASVDKVKIFGNHIRYAKGAGINVGGVTPSGVTFDGHMIQKNLIEYTGDDLIQTAGYGTISDNIMRYNYPGLNFHADGIQIIGGSYFKIYNNKIYDRTDSAYAIINMTNKSGTYSNWYVYNNLIYYSDKSIVPSTIGVFFLGRNIHEPNGAFVPKVNWENIVIANNTFVNLNKGSVLGFSRRTGEVGQVSIKNVTISNNIFYEISGINFETTDTPSIVFDKNSFLFTHNLIVGGNPKFLMAGKMEYGTVNELNELPGFDNNISQVPTFKNLSAGDFKSLDGSPVINAGTNLSSYFNQDFSGVSRPQGSSWDIGAYEYVHEGQGITPLSAEGLIAHINFDGDNFASSPSIGVAGSFLTFQDKSGQVNPATCFRTVVVDGINYTMNQCPNATTGPDNSPAAEFYGNLCDVQSDHLGIANSPELNNLKKGTIALWVNYNSGSPYKDAHLIDNFKDFLPRTWHLGRDGTTSNVFKAITDSGIPTRILMFPDNGLYNGSFNTWNHLAVTWDGVKIRGYFNGTLFDEVSQSGFTSFDEGTYITIGALNHGLTRNKKDTNCSLYYGGSPNQTYVQPNAGFLNGKMDDVRIYNRALSTSDISQLATAPLKRQTNLVKVIKQGDGHGVVKSSVLGIDCGNYCSEAYNPGTSLILTAVASTDSVFAGWSGACTGTGVCSIVANQHVTVTANFTSVLEKVALIEAESVNFTSPFENRGGYIVQPSWGEKTPLTGGRVEFVFTLNEPSEVMVVGKVNTPSSASDSFFVNIDGEPTDPHMVWDIGTTVGFADRIVSWRGNGTSNVPGINPKWFNLSAGQHKLIVIGREAFAQLDSVTVLRKKSTTVVLLPGDFNSDNRVNSLDFSALSSKWNQSSSTHDLNKDGTVNSLDFSLMAKNWTG